MFIVLADKHGISWDTLYPSSFHLVATSQIHVQSVISLDNESRIFSYAISDACAGPFRWVL
jgi:hypothetical protein